MDGLWSRDETTDIRELVDELQQERETAYTTVQTVMDNLHRKGWLSGSREAGVRLSPGGVPAGVQRPAHREARHAGHDADLT